MARLSAQIQKRKMRPKKAKIVLDTISAKPPRGRPARARFSEIRGRADNYRWIFDQVWDHLWPLLSTVQTEDEVVNAFQKGARPYEREFVPALAGLLIKVVRERKFPKRREARINFLADSLAGLGRISPRRSRDICERERAKQKQAHHIIRYEFFVECSCGYKGRSYNHACPRCGAAICFSLGPMLSCEFL